MKKIIALVLLAICMPIRCASNPPDIFEINFSPLDIPPVQLKPVEVKHALTIPHETTNQIIRIFTAISGLAVMLFGLYTEKATLGGVGGATLLASRFLMTEITRFDIEGSLT